MAQRTLGALTTEALHDDFDATKYAATAEQGIKDAIVDLARRVRLPSIETTGTITTVAGTRTYSLPSASVQLVAVTRSGDQLEFREDYHDVLADSSTARGTPTSYAIYGSSIALDPIPSAAETITLAYLGEGAIPGSADVVTAIEDADQWLLVCFARARLFAKEDDPQMAAFWRAEYENGLRLAKASIQRRVNNANRRVAGPYTGNLTWPRFQTR